MSAKWEETWGTIRWDSMEGMECGGIKTLDEMRWDRYEGSTLSRVVLLLLSEDKNDFVTGLRLVLSVYIVFQQLYIWVISISQIGLRVRGYEIAEDETRWDGMDGRGLSQGVYYLRWEREGGNMKRCVYGECFDEILVRFERWPRREYWQSFVSKQDSVRSSMGSFLNLVQV